MQPMISRLRELFADEPLLSQVIWKEGSTSDISINGLHYPAVPMLHAGGRVVLTEGQSVGHAAFHTWEGMASALEEARRHMSVGRLAPLPIEQRQPLQLVDGRRRVLSPTTSHEHLQALWEEVRVGTDGPLHVRSQESLVDTWLLSREGDLLTRHEQSTVLSVEHLERTTGRIQVEHLIFQGLMEDFSAESKQSLLVAMKRGAGEECDSFSSGHYPCLMSEQVAGVFLHEVVGHLFEADTATAPDLRKRYGENIAPELVTVYEKPDVLFDDEGVLTGTTWMIAEGKVHHLLHSRETARQMGHRPNGHGRSLRGWHPAIPRMHHTMMDAGDANPYDLRREFPKTIYLEEIEHATSRAGVFTLQIKRAALLERGRCVQELGRVIVRGRCLEALQQIVGVGRERNTQMQSCWKKQQDGLIVSTTAPCVLFASLWLGKE